MAIADKLTSTRQRICVVAKTLDDLDAADRAAVEDYMRNARTEKQVRPHSTRYPLTHLAKVLAEAGYLVSSKALCTHTFGRCICEVSS